MAAEVIGGILADSIAIISDALHLLSDLSGFAISILSVWISNKTPQASYTFGYHRAGVIGAFVNIMVIWGLTGVLIYEALWRIVHIDEVEVDGVVMFWTSLVGLICNLVMAKVLHSHPGHGHHGCSHGHDHGHSHGEKLKHRDSDEELIDIEPRESRVAKKKLVDSYEDLSAISNFFTF
jgi:solute carrier family 30 (zinc transporter), member 2